MKNCLILLTKNFPFQGGETFLRSEIPLLVNNFDKIIIISAEVLPKSKQEWDISEKIEICRINQLPNNLKRLKYLINSMFVSKDDLYKTEKIMKATSPKKVISLKYYDAKVRDLTVKIVKKLKNFNFDEFRSITIYSYWFFDITNVAVELEKKFFQDKAIHIVTRAHGYDLYEERNKANYFPYREYTLENIDYVFACSINGRNYLQEKYPEYKGKIKHSYLGTYDYGIQTSQTKNGFHILSCSNIIPVKRVDFIAEALKEIDSKNIKIKWTHIGDGKQKNKLETWCRKNLDIEFVFLGNLNNEAVMEFYKNNFVDVFINTSESEGLPVSIMEAMSFGVPVLATDVGGTKEIVVDGCTGILFDSSAKPKEIANKLEKFILQDNDYKMMMRNNARQHWLDNFKAENNYMDFIAKINCL